MPARLIQQSIWKYLARPRRAVIEVLADARPVAHINEYVAHSELRHKPTAYWNQVLQAEAVEYVDADEEYYEPTAYWNQALQAEAVEYVDADEEYYEQMGSVERSARFGWLGGWGPHPRVFGVVVESGC